ncbi:hypothetical protein C7N43_37810 [Sphingobacteriales bacterium UPWRP_1]|nr:hypothetical protein BVG80_17975 [Sphingobacteriales bacterium TSM_CSM]PSJ71734.1 hypothetical protein C7N43_37810 [Sphingobacteriales bacterium UPWRP_1]
MAAILALWFILVQCGYFPWGEEVRFGLFNPNTAGLPQHKPFYFTTRFLHNGADEVYKQGIDENLAEWEAYFNKKCTAKMVENLLYANDFEFNIADADIENLDQLKETPAYAQSVVRYLLNKPDYETLAYLVFAKQCERELVVFTYNAWDYSDEETNNQPTDDKLQALNSLLETAKIQIAKAPNDFLRLRYGYQMVVLTRYLNDWAQCAKLYKQYVETSPATSVLRYWAMQHYGTALFHLGKKAEADYQFSMVYANCANKRVRAWLGFEGENLKATLALAKNNAQKADIWTLKALHNPGLALDDMIQVYALNPASPLLKLLLSREINKLEDWLLTPRLTDFDATSAFLKEGYNFETIQKNNEINDLEYLRRLLAFITKALTEGKNPDAAFLNLSAAYLYFMDNKYADANRYLDLAMKAPGATEEVKRQVRLTRLMSFANDKNAINPDFENRLLKDIRWLQQQMPKQNRSFDYYYEENQSTWNEFDRLMYALAYRYENAGNRAKAGLFLSHINNLLRAQRKDGLFGYYNDYFFYYDENATTAELEQLVQLIDKPDKTEFEYFLTQQAIPDRNKFIDLIGTKHMRADNFELAQEAFKRLPNDYWNSNTFAYNQYLNANPFYVDFYSEHIPTVGDTISYNKLQFATRMLELKQLAETQKNRAWYYFLQANGYYSITYYGNSWMQVRYGWTANWQYTLPVVDKYEDQANYFGCRRAEELYQKAAAVSKDPGFTALCHRMSGKCQHRRKIYETALNANPASDDFYDQPAPTFEENTHYQLLKKDFGQFYDRLINDCTSIADFLARKDKS